MRENWIEQTMNTEKIIAIGDIHGCLDALNEILEMVKSYPEHRLVFLGDYIDRGPFSDEVLSRLRKLEDSIFLCGNHELWLIQAVDGIKNKKEKIKYLKEKKISESNFQWLKDNLQFIYQTENYIFTHSGLNKQKSLEEQNDNDYTFSKFESDYLNLTSKVVVYGHSSLPEVLIEKNKIQVDTGCAVGGYLSAILLPEKIVIRSQQTENYLKASVQDLIKNFKKQIQNQ